MASGSCIKVEPARLSRLYNSTLSIPGKHTESRPPTRPNAILRLNILLEMIQLGSQRRRQAECERICQDVRDEGGFPLPTRSHSNTLAEYTDDQVILKLRLRGIFKVTIRLHRKPQHQCHGHQRQ